MKPPFVRVLHQGDHGPDVVAVKRALIKWGAAPQGITLNPLLGARAESVLRRFQQREKLHVDGVYGPATHKELSPYFDEYGASLLVKEQHQLQAAAEPRNRFLQIADLTVQHQPLFRYTMAIGDRPGYRGWFRNAPLDQHGANWAEVEREHGAITCDCSQHYIGCGHHAGFHGVFGSDGATGALLAALDHISLHDAQPGDGVVFVGAAHPEGVHITILRSRMPDGNWRVVNMGGSGQPKYGDLWAEQAFHARVGAPGIVVVRLPA